ncbi:hypothetical protein HDV57DRAFT_147194 [Trichoderma longibrachiatum]|uniref:Uncharacterized protein n=1 Tax=Trichoderma longibrachiatum ATCC 18648 TaxID=983965 RepID=A0A2T4C764_TRILO|nr:hypothetical protein M440DRAFT_1210599 [Trichoderma longibrachiatum ATCC 18648]
MTHSRDSERRKGEGETRQKSRGVEDSGISKVGGSGRGSQIRASRYTADEVMLALANQKIGHEARDFIFRSRTGVDFYFSALSGRTTRAGGARASVADARGTGTCELDVHGMAWAWPAQGEVPRPKYRGCYSGGRRFWCVFFCSAVGAQQVSWLGSALLFLTCLLQSVVRPQQRVHTSSMRLFPSLHRPMDAVKENTLLKYIKQPRNMGIATKQLSTTTQYRVGNDARRSPSATSGHRQNQNKTPIAVAAPRLLRRFGLAQDRFPAGEKEGLVPVRA